MTAEFCGLEGCNCADPEVRPVDLVRRLTAFGRDLVFHGDMTPAGERMLKVILNHHLDQCVQWWHGSPSGLPLSEFLGMSEEEYAVWTKDATLP